MAVKKELPTVDPKMLSAVKQGNELVRSLDDEALCEALLEGVVYKVGDDEENGRSARCSHFSPQKMRRSGSSTTQRRRAIMRPQSEQLTILTSYQGLSISSQ